MPCTLFGATSRLAPAFGLTALLAALAAAPAAAQTPILNMLPSAGTLQPGQGLTLEIVLNDRPSASPVAFFDLDIVFDPAVLRFEGLQLGSALGDIAEGQAVNASLPPDLANGVVNLAVLSLLPSLNAQPASPVFGQLSFSAIGLGPSGLGFGFSAVEAAGGVAIPHLRLDATVAVVPEPAAAWLLAAGLLALGARYRQQADAPARG